MLSDPNISLLWQRDVRLLLSISKKKTTLQVRSTLFVHFFDVVLHDYNVKLPSSFYVGKCGMSSPMFCRVPVHFFFLHCRSFSPCWPPFLIFSPPFPSFSSNEICLCFLSNALALLSMSLKTLTDLVGLDFVVGFSLF